MEERCFVVGARIGSRDVLDSVRTEGVAKEGGAETIRWRQVLKGTNLMTECGLLRTLS